MWKCEQVIMNEIIIRSNKSEYFPGEAICGYVILMVFKILAGVICLSLS